MLKLDFIIMMKMKATEWCNGLKKKGKENHERRSSGAEHGYSKDRIYILFDAWKKTKQNHFWVGDWGDFSNILLGM